MQNLNVGLIQTKLFWEDKASNFLHFESIFDTIKGKDIHLLLLPEMFNSGFSMNVDELAESMSGESISWLILQSKRLNCSIGTSLIIKEKDEYFNRFVIVNEKGVETYYDKRHLFRIAGENKYFTAGKERVIYKINGWKILLQVCYDLRFPVFARNRKKEEGQEYDLLIYIANWPEKRIYAWRNLLQARAIENQVYCIGVNRIGLDGNGFNYSGDSMAVNPWGKIDLECAKNKESVEILTLEKEVILDINKRFPAFKDAD